MDGRTGLVGKEKGNFRIALFLIFAGLVLSEWSGIW